MQLGTGIEIFYFVVLIFSIIIHEVAHGYAANSLGDPTARLAGRLTLNPAPHIDLIGSIIVPLICVLSPGHFLFGWAKPVPYNPYNLKNQRWGEAFVAIAGVATNLILALVFALVSRFATGAGYDAFASAAQIVVLVNLSLGIFNLIPFPPLDGFTFLRGLLPYKYALVFRRFEAAVEQNFIIFLVGFLLLFNYLFAGIFSNAVYYLFKVLVGAS